jgi:hypothetical protein
MNSPDWSRNRFVLRADVFPIRWENRAKLRLWPQSEANLGGREGHLLVGSTADRRRQAARLKTLTSAPDTQTRTRIDLKSQNLTAVGSRSFSRMMLYAVQGT